MKIIVKVVDSKSNIKVDGRTLLPMVENTVIKTEAVKVLIKKGILKFERNIVTPPKIEKSIQKKKGRANKTNQK